MIVSSMLHLIKFRQFEARQQQACREKKFSQSYMYFGPYTLLFTDQNMGKFRHVLQQAHKLPYDFCQSAISWYEQEMSLLVHTVQK